MSDQADPKIVVFISYSWDDEDHRQWVKKLASDLVEAGIDVRLDVWDTDLGDDLAHYMETAVRESHRVLLVCTEPYVRKADAGKGGVGYEKMIVTGELVTNLGTRKFIPVIRQGVEDKVTPSFLASRKYIDFRVDAEYKEKLAELIESLKKSETPGKPIMPIALVATSKGVAIATRNDMSVYEKAMEIIPREDMLGWRKIVQEHKRNFKTGILNWRTKYDGAPPAVKDEILARFEGAVEVAAPLITLALAGVESGNKVFADQRALLDELVDIPNWPRSGFTSLVEAPHGLGFVYHCLHGAAAIQSMHPELALKLAISHVDRESGPRHLFLDPRYMGWSEALGRHCIESWNYLYTAVPRWTWLQDVFGDETDYQISLIAYLMMLSFVEYLDALKKSVILTPGKMQLTVPPVFLRMPGNVVRKAVRQAVNTEPALKELATAWKIDTATAVSNWGAWIETLDNWGNSWDRMLSGENPLKNFMDEIGWTS